MRDQCELYSPVLVLENQTNASSVNITLYTNSVGFCICCRLIERAQRHGACFRSFEPTSDDADRIHIQSSLREDSDAFGMPLIPSHSPK